MRLAVISDVHGNLEALRSVLADIDRSKADATVCLGDNVGYGPEPEAVVELVRQRNIPCVMGNHELGVVDADYLGWFNATARRSLEINRRLLSPATVDFLGTLPATLVQAGCLCVHGCPPASITTYLFEVRQTELLQLLPTLEQRICFVGHTHDLELVDFDGRVVSIERLQRGLLQLQQRHRYIVNVGSVGQPRDGNNNAKYVIWDSGLDQLEVRFVAYDISATVRKILQLGLPAINAKRLW